jgi:hypothetical protein
LLEELLGLPVLMAGAVVVEIQQLPEIILRQVELEVRVAMEEQDTTMELLVSLAEVVAGLAVMDQQPQIIELVMVGMGYPPPLRDPLYYMQEVELELQVLAERMTEQPGLEVEGRQVQQEQPIRVGAEVVLLDQEERAEDLVSL